MYLVELKALFVHALNQTFTSNYPVPDFRKVNVGIEYPEAPQFYPGVWVDYTSSAPLRQAGVAHTEIVDEDGVEVLPHTRFRFEGSMSFTVVALSSQERDRLFDEMVRTFAFGKENLTTSLFRATVEDNDLIAVNAKFDEIQVGGETAAPGTPWGSDDMIYESTLSLDVIGEFIADPTTGELVHLSRILVTPVVDISLPDYVPDPDVPADDGKGAWH